MLHVMTRSSGPSGGAFVNRPHGMHAPMSGQHTTTRASDAIAAERCRRTAPAANEPPAGMSQTQRGENIKNVAGHQSSPSRSNAQTATTATSVNQVQVVTTVRTIRYDPLALDPELFDAAVNWSPQFVYRVHEHSCKQRGQCYGKRVIVSTQSQSGCLFPDSGSHLQIATP